MSSLGKLINEFILQSKNAVKESDQIFCDHIEENQLELRENNLLYITCKGCNNYINLQNFLFALPWSSSIYLANLLHLHEDQSLIAKTTIRCNVLLSMPDDAPTVIKLKLDDFHTMFRMFAMTSGLFYQLKAFHPSSESDMEIDYIPQEKYLKESIEKEVTSLCYNYEEPENSKVLNEYEKKLNLLIEEQMNLLKNLISKTDDKHSNTNHKLLLDMLNVISSTMSGMKKNTDSDNFNPVLMIKNCFLPELSILQEHFYKPKERIYPTNIALSTLYADWFEYFQTLLVEARETYGKLIHNIDFCISALFLSLLLMHKETNPVCSLPKQMDAFEAGKILIGADQKPISLSDITEKETRFNS